jgi:hypothetical protein
MNRRRLMVLLGAALLAACGRKADPKWSKETDEKKKKEN